MIDLFGSERQYVDHLLPIWLGLPAGARGTAYLPRGMERTIMALREQGHRAERGRPRRGVGPTLVAAAQDEWVISPSPVAYLEHGAGQTYESDPRSAGHASYSGGEKHPDVRVFLCPNETVADRWRARYPEVPAVAVGCPRLDRWHLDPAVPEPGLIAVSFHPDLPLIPETTGAWGHYDRILESLTERFRLLGHGHPRLWPHLEHRWKRLGIERARDFATVAERASLYLVDNSSTGPEFASLGRPVIWLNAPQYRRDVHHGGRFWEWRGTIGPAVDGPEALADVIEAVLEDPSWGVQGREEALEQIYGPRDGKATERAVMAVTEVFGG